MRFPMTMKPRLALTLCLVWLIGCVSMAAPKAAVPGRPTLLYRAAAPAQLQWTVPVSSAVLNSYVPGQKISTDGGTTYVAPVNLDCTGTATMTCTADFPPATKGTYQTRVQICDTQGAKTRCTEGPITAIDFLPAPASPSAPACPTGCNELAPMSIIAELLDPPSGALTTATLVTLTTTGPVASVRLEVLSATDGHVVCECEIRGGPNAWSATLRADQGPAGAYALRPSATDSNGSTVVGPAVTVIVG